jgi:hypothetical protein
MADTLPPLDKFDPTEAWRPWRPTAADPWGRKWAAHLYRRAAFGPGRSDLREAERLGPDGTLDLLLNGRPWAADFDESLADVGRVAAARDDGGVQLRGWWLYAMLYSAHPLREKLTLFWHNHFATSIVKVRDAGLMYRQNSLLREHALGKVGPLVHAVGRDGAMLVWLDANRNVAGRPNENYARELMELFTLGVGHYTEADVREAARAFTGWHTDGAGFAFRPTLHDDGPKTVLGKTGRWGGDDVAAIVLARPAAARFLVRKLYRLFVSEAADPPAALLEPLADAFRASDYDVAALVRTVLLSRLFYSEHAFRQRIKSPVEFVLGAVRAVVDRPAADRPLPPDPLARWVAAMGQPLFAPPNVKGWAGGPAWLNTSTMLERDNFAAALALGTLWTGPAGGSTEEPAPPQGLDPARLPRDEGVSEPDAVIGALLDLYLPGGVRPEVRAKLAAFVADGKPVGAALDRRVREAVQIILTTADYQLA